MRRRAIWRAHAVMLLLALVAAVAPWVVLAVTVNEDQFGAGGGPPGSNWTTVNCWNEGAGPVPVAGDDVVLGFSTDGPIQAMPTSVSS